jgi:hypothetical protein
MEEVMTLIKQVAIAAAVAGLSVSAYAQTAGQPGDPATRAEVRQDMINVENAGYDPATSDHTTYPAQAQAAERRVAEQEGQSAGYGGVTTGTTSSGAMTQPMQRHNNGSKDIYFGQ